MASYSMSRRKQTQVLETGPFLDTDVVIGRDRDRDSMVTRLCHYSNDHKSPSADAIVGIGGQGKTTLAQYLYNDKRVKGCFEVRLWVSCTPDISVKEVLLRILASAIDENKSSECQLVQLQNWISRAVAGKKFILFLDNVWEGESQETWGQLKALFKFGSNGSKILITTRSETVARNMNTFDPYMLRDLSEEDSWRLFKHFAFKKGKKSGVEAIGKQIATMIPRVPLVIKVIGCHLSEKGTIKQWQAFKNDLASNSSSHVRDNIMKTLKISYDQLDKKLKLCVAYCSLFPKGTCFNVDKMVRIWSGLGYVKSESGNLEDVGEKYVIDLVRCGFFQEVMYEDHGHLKWFDMHGIMHDLVLSIDRSLYQMVDSRTREIAKTVSHVSFHKTKDSNWETPSSALNINQQQSILMVDAAYDFKSKQCRVLFPCGCDKLLSRFKCLKVLDLHNLRIEKVPQSVTTLVHLRYLDLSGNLMCKLPNSITQLVNLLSLDLSYCKYLEELPRDMRKLVKLRHLLLYGCSSLSHMPKGLGKLKELQTLDWFVVGEDTSESSRSKGSVVGGLIELSDLNNLKGSLGIIVDRESKYIAAEAKTVHLERKEQLIELVIEFKKSGKDDYMVLEALEPHGANLKYLYIRNYGGEKLPDWIGTLNSLKYLIISGCLQLDKLSDSIGSVRVHIL